MNRASHSFAIPTSSEQSTKQYFQSIYTKYEEQEKNMRARGCSFSSNLNEKHHNNSKLTLCQTVSEMLFSKLF